MAILRLNNKANEYNLYGSMTAELIDIYGFEVTYIKTNKLGKDEVIGDITNFSFNDSLQIMVMPDNLDGVMEERGDFLNKFGFFTNDGINLYLSADTMKNIVGEDLEFNKCYGDLIKLPSGKFLEIVSVEHQVPGINNQYVYSNIKKVFQFRCKSFNFNFDNLPPSAPEVPPSVENQEQGNPGDFFEQNPRSSIEEIFGIIDDANNPDKADVVSITEMKELQEQQSPIIKTDENKDQLLGEMWS